MGEIREISITRILNPSNYTLYFNDSTPLEKIEDIYYFSGKKASEFLYEMRSELRSLSLGKDILLWKIKQKENL